MTDEGHIILMGVLLSGMFLFACWLVIEAARCLWDGVCDGINWILNIIERDWKVNNVQRNR